MDLLILGAGTRPAAFSALRAGRRPACADLFSDADLAASCPSARIEAADYPDALLAFADGIAPTEWLYTGALENRPDLVDAISRRHRLLGNSGATLRSIRDPVALGEAVRASGLMAPEVRPDPAGLPRDGSWLRKPLASASGRGIRPWTGGEPSRTGCYFQRRIEGIPLASIHVGDGSGAELAGITRQILGRPGRPFAYVGSIGPWPVEPEARDRVARLGRAVASAFGLVGVFGIDFVLADGHPWPVEVNPRYTASVEVLEWALGRSILADHLRASGSDAPAGSRPVGDRPAFVAKAIVFADRPGTWAEAATGPGPSGFPEIADIPRLGTTFQAGEPVFTAFAAGPTESDCLASLARESERWPLRPGC